MVRAPSHRRPKPRDGRKRIRRYGYISRQKTGNLTLTRRLLPTVVIVRGISIPVTSHSNTMKQVRESDLRVKFKDLPETVQGGCHARVWLPEAPPTELGEYGSSHPQRLCSIHIDIDIDIGEEPIG
jgi:hypothetical protein